MQSQIPRLFIVIPCYNEEEVLPITLGQFTGILDQMSSDGLVSKNSKVLLVNDGSTDATWHLLKGYAQDDSRVAAISLSRNRGHQNALLAGLMTAMEHADVTISIDCDGQDDISVMPQMVRRYLDGCDVVYGVRKRRETDTAFKRMTAESFYKIMNAMGAETVFNHADYRLASKRALEGLSEFGEVNLFLRGMFPLVGYESDIVYYDREERIAGESHYPLGKMLSLAVDGVTSLSMKPIRAITGFGAFVFVVSMLWLIVSLVLRAELLVVIASIISLLAGAQILALGVVGEYVGKAYLETKARPRYIVAEHVGLD